MGTVPGFGTGALRVFDNQDGDSPEARDSPRANPSLLGLIHL